MSSSDLKNNIEKVNNLDNALRPETWDEYIGQKRIKDNLFILLKAAIKRKQSPEHLLFYGPPGLGKTSISFLIAKELGSQIRVSSGPAIEKVGDLASILSNLQDGDILFIDEIHRLNKNIEEVLYPAMESGVLDIVVGKGPSARVVQLSLSQFTLIAATTQVSRVSAPLRSRFSGGVHRLEYYSNEEIARILQNSAQKLGLESIEDSVFMEIAKRSRKTPRRANYLLKRVRDFAEVHNRKIDKTVLEEVFSLLNIDEHGLDSSDLELLKTIEFKYSGGPVGLKTLAASLSEEESTLEEVLEPYLLQEGFIERTARGRQTTKKAKRLLESNLD